LETVVSTMARICPELLTSVSVDQGASSKPLDLLAFVLGRRVVDVGDDHVGAHLRQCHRAGPPDPLTGTRDDCDSVLQTHDCSFFSEFRRGPSVSGRGRLQPRPILSISCHQQVRQEERDLGYVGDTSPAR